MTTLSNIPFNFKAGEISSDARSLCLSQFSEQIGLLSALENVLGSKPERTRPGAPVQYSPGELAFHYIFGLMQGYQNPSEMDRAKDDPVLGELTGKTPSQASFSRFLTNLTEPDEQQLRGLNQQVLEQYLKMKVEQNEGRKLPVLNISNDSTKVETYGKQEGSAYIHHYRTNGYHPDLLTDDDFRIVLSCLLRNGNTYSSTGSEEQLKAALAWLSEYYELIVFRADSAYGKPEILNVLNDEGIVEKVKIEYFIKAKTYRSWVREADVFVEHEGEQVHILKAPRDYFEEMDEKTGESRLADRFVSFSQQCDSWDNPEQIVARVRYQDSDQEALLPEDNKDIEMIIVRSEKRGEEAFTEYGKRGMQEQIIEEFKNESFAGTLSHREKEQNAAELQLKVLAHNLMQILRLEGLKNTVYARCRTATMRYLLVKIGGKIVRHGRTMLLKLSSCFAYRRWFELVMDRIPLIRFQMC